MKIRSPFLNGLFEVVARDEGKTDQVCETETHGSAPSNYPHEGKRNNYDKLQKHNFQNDTGLEAGKS
jgi:hypothetical protein